jgi:predicted metal-dependent HD superfamily phosphohydrolase
MSGPELLQSIREAAPDDLHLPERVWRELLERYSEPHRHYHDLVHIRELTKWYREVAEHVAWQFPREVFLALLLHDAIYEPTRSDNEELSAALAQALLREPGLAGIADAELVCRLILLTARHGSHDARTLAADEALFLDCDMAILAAPPAEFEAYEAGIKAEYVAVPEPIFNAGRAAFLRSLLERQHIFLSDYFQGRLEGSARSNVAAALQRLR